MDARIWCYVVKKTQTLDTMTWPDFVQVFNKKYYNATLLATRVNEFVTLTQGSLPVTEYA